jgi:hypothetical protein
MASTQGRFGQSPNHKPSFNTIHSCC